MTTLSIVVGVRLRKLTELTPSTSRHPKPLGQIYALTFALGEAQVITPPPNNPHDGTPYFELNYPKLPQVFHYAHFLYQNLTFKEV
jgi:hypothetical protein